MSDFNYVFGIVVIGASAYFALMARHHARKAAKALEDTKAAIAAWWKRVEEGR